MDNDPHKGLLRLGVNIDHVATLRNARGGEHPDPVRAAALALASGADGITAHLREDRRHIRDDDMVRIHALCLEKAKPLNLEMAATEDMLTFALKHRPHAVCLVPEKREERTTEGGLDMRHAQKTFPKFVTTLRENSIRVSLFIEPKTQDILIAKDLGADVVEFHTGAYCEMVRSGDDSNSKKLLNILHEATLSARSQGLEIHAGHGIDFESVTAIAAIPEIVELNIGHYLIGEAIFTGLSEAIFRMRRLMLKARGL